VPSNKQGMRKVQKPAEMAEGEPTQLDKFKQAARELECDDSEEAFREKLKKLTEAPPPESVKERKPKLGTGTRKKKTAS
jgi:hypothetical protein